MYILVSHDLKNKLRVAYVSASWKDSENGYVITRQTGLYNGKLIKAPDIVITKGKVSRTIKEQTKLQLTSVIREYLDKGYKLLEKPISEYSEDELHTLVGEVITGSNAIPKPMLAKQADKVTKKEIFDKEYFASRKIDGLRILIYQDEKGNLKTSSRGSKNYDSAMIEILNNPKLIEMFNNNPNLILDGEGYKHGETLQSINSIARSQKNIKDLEFMQFYWYDILDLTMTAEERINKMKSLAEEYNIGFDPFKQFESGELRVQLVPQQRISGWDNMIKLHNDFVEEGWEGLVIRRVDSKYTPNGRSNDMIKIKVYQSSEFLVTGYELGLRGSEDMVFICKTSDNQEFKAKPLGTREQKEEYVENFESKYKNHMGECKFFYYSEDNIPLQPAFKVFRFDLE